MQYIVQYHDHEKIMEGLRQFREESNGKIEDERALCMRVRLLKLALPQTIIGDKSVALKLKYSSNSKILCVTHSPIMKTLLSSDVADYESFQAAYDRQNTP